MQQFANPTRFLRLAEALQPWAYGAAAVAFVVGLYLGLVASPADYQQGETVRIMYVHVPAAWMALFTYTFMALAHAGGFIARHPIAHLAGRAAAPIGACFAFLALATGSLWGKPMWGTWWVWDARLTSMFVLFLLYLGYIAVWQSMGDPQRAQAIAGIVAMVGFINVPIIKFSVDWWNSLHQPASVLRLGGPHIDTAILRPLLVMALAYTLLFAGLFFTAMKSHILSRRLDQMRLAAAREA